MFRTVINFATIVLLALIVFGAGATACGIGDDCDDNLGIAALRTVGHSSSQRPIETRNEVQKNLVAVSFSTALPPVIAASSHSLVSSSDVLCSQPVVTPLRS